MSKRPILILIGLLFLQHLNSQGKPSENVREAYLDGEYFMALEFYVDALEEFNSVYKRGMAGNANLNYRIGICYLNIPGQKENAIQYLEMAAQNVDLEYEEGSLKEFNAPINAILYLGDAYRVNNQLDIAIDKYLSYIKEYPTENRLDMEYARKQILACKQAKKAMLEPVVFDKENLGAKVNSKHSNYAAVISGDSTTLIYVSELPFYDAVFMCTWQDTAWSAPINITPQIQSDGDQYVASLSYNADELYLVKEGVFDSDIYVSVRQEDGSWGPSAPLNRAINTKYWESHASLSKDGQTMYFSSDRKGGYGGKDIYISQWNNEGYWDEPVNAGDRVNTKYDEDFPFVLLNGERLYFSSNGHDNMGGSDIFYAIKNKKGQFIRPVNVGYPVNTTDDDNFFFPLGNGQAGLKAIISDDGYGKEDIYEVHIDPDGLKSSLIFIGGKDFFQQD